MANECNIRVVCRVRPLNDAEERVGSKICVKFPSDTEDTLILSGKVYVFDKVFKPDSNQEKVYTHTAKQIVEGNLHISTAFISHYIKGWLKFAFRNIWRDFESFFLYYSL